MSEMIKKQEILHNIALEVGRRVASSEKQSAETFAKAYYENVSFGDLTELSLEELVESVHAMWVFGHKRVPGGHPKIRVYSEEIRRKDDLVPQTIVEIVNDNMPFLVDSVSGAINSLGYAINLVIHPVVPVERDEHHELVAILDPASAPPSTSYESFIHCEILGTLSPKKREELQHEIARSLQDVRDAVEDWEPMRERLQAMMAHFKVYSPPVTKEEIDETLAFLEWLEEGHFTFLGFCEYTLSTGQETLGGSLVPQAGLGILKNPLTREMTYVFGEVELTPTNRRYMGEPEPLLITKASQISLVHRRDAMDSLILKRFDRKGNVTGLYQFIGLFTSVAYNQSARKIPFLRLKMARILDRSGFSEQWHDGKTLIHTLESFPRDELFQATETWLFETSMAIMQLQNRQRLTLFIRPDKFERFVSCVVYIPRERYDSDLRRKIEKILEKDFQGKGVNWQAQLSELAFARVHYTITRLGKEPLLYDSVAIEREIVNEALSWRDHLLVELRKQRGDTQGKALFEKYDQGFTKGYQEGFSPETAVTDILEIEKAFSTNRLGSHLQGGGADTQDVLSLKLYAIEGPVSLSDMLPVLENMNLRVLSEIPFVVTLSHGKKVWIHDVEVQNRAQNPISLELVRNHFLKGFSHIWVEDCENDGFNRLILSANFDWHDCQLIRAYAKYIRQLQVTFSQVYMEETLTHYPCVTQLMMALFTCQFSPTYTQDRSQKRQEILSKISLCLRDVKNLDEEIILRKFVNAIEATVRTNYYQLDKDNKKNYISFKIDCEKIEEMPLPRPQYEIFVYSPQVEGIHLRGGKVARGGIRWSERREDFRTEILGLMKAQMVKNAVIIPVGSKGGFIVKRPSSAKVLQEDVIGCYEVLIRGLLDITDNIKDGQIFPPPQVIRYDEDDPYLVVAADKGTSSFSDCANRIAAQYDFWLGDAFASGGSTGYDHKKMGITARGAWESVKRHFSEMGRDATTEVLEVVGIGDMSGDVFGNGMLLSPHLKLVGAFNHSHIFIDPSPIPETSYRERKRLFFLPHSTWADYKPGLLSKGGGVFERQAKSILITPEMKARFDIEETVLTPTALIRYLLQASVDLLWFGGIGTYVKAQDETHSEVGDRGNDGVRVNGERIRALVIAEGANLGLTQGGRIAYAMQGGRLNTDGIDNSAGVDCSDHEVNIKILLNPIMAKGELLFEKRNALLEAMTERVAQLVLEDNIWQNQAISLAQSQGFKLFNEQASLLRTLETEGILNRSLENLPDEVELGRRATTKQALTRPELAVLLAYAKISLKQQLIGSDLSDLPLLQERLLAYFPGLLQQTYAKEIMTHPLKREIISTLLTNRIIDKMGITFIQEVKRQANVSDVDIVKAYIVAEELLNLRPLWEEIEILKKVEATVQIDLILRTCEKIKRFIDWFLRFGGLDTDLEKVLCEFKPGFELLYDRCPHLFPPLQRQVYKDKYTTYEEMGLPPSLIKRLLSLRSLISAPDIIMLSSETQVDIEIVARVYFTLGQQLHLEWLRQAALSLSGDTPWQQEAVSVFIEDIYKNQAAITKKILKKKTYVSQFITPEETLEPAVLDTTSLEALFLEIMNVPIPDFPMLMVVNHHLHLLARPE